MTAQLEKDWKSMACLEGLQEKVLVMWSMVEEMEVNPKADRQTNGELKSLLNQSKGALEQTNPNE